MNQWAYLGYLVAGMALNILTYVALVRKNRKMEENFNKRTVAREGREALQHEMMWRDFKDRKHINGAKGGAA